MKLKIPDVVTRIDLSNAVPAYKEKPVDSWMTGVLDQIRARHRSGR